jgi:hypothetical protein
VSAATETTSSYRAYGLTIRSAIPLPELSVGSGAADVDIVIGTVSERAGWRQAGPRLFGAPGVLRFGPRSRARILASHGRSVVVQLGPGVTQEIVRPYLLSSAMGAVLHQRAFLPLHASVAETELGCVALMGHRGAGKSTLAAFIASTGGAAVSAAICALTFVDGRPTVHPNRQRFKLADDAAEHLGIERDGAERLPGGKLSLAVCTSAEDAPKPLRAIFVLAAAAAFSVRRLESVEALAALIEHTFRPRYVVGLGIEREHLRRCAAVVATTPVFSLSTVRDLSRLAVAAGLLTRSSQSVAGVPA